MSFERIMRAAMAGLVAAGWVSSAAAATGSFAEVVNSNGAFLTTSSTQVIGRGVSLSVGQVFVNISRVMGERTFVDFIYEGKEAGFRNAFRFGGSTLFDTNAAGGTRARQELTQSSLLDFSFFVADTGGAVSNGQNRRGDPRGFGILLDASGRNGVLAFDDGGGGPDRDFDDMVVRFQITTSPIPEPSTWALMAGGLLALAAARRRQR